MERENANQPLITEGLNMTESKPGAGEIRSVVVYTLREFVRRTGVSRHRLRKLGLKPRIFGNRGYILGDEFVEIVRNASCRFSEHGPDNERQGCS